MEAAIAFDTCFLIDLQRELRDQRVGSTQRFLKAHGRVAACLSAVALGEFTEGFPDLNHPVLVRVRNAFTVLGIDEETAERYAQIARALRPRGRLIGSNDLWIAASALRHGLALVSNDVKHFGRVPDLNLLRY